MPMPRFHMTRSDAEAVFYPRQAHSTTFHGIFMTSLSSILSMRIKDHKLEAKP
jgi:hypothetical protein